MSKHLIFYRLLKLVILISLIFITQKYSSAQITFQKDYIKSYSPSLLDLEPTQDGGAVFLAEFGLTKTDCKGDIEWTKQSPYSFSSHRNANKILLTEEEEILMATGIKVFPQVSNNSPHIHLMKYDELGNLIWQKQYGKVEDRQFPKTITSTPNSGYLIGASLTELPFDSTSNFYFLQIDSTGSLLWTKTFGESEWENNIISSIADNDGNTFHIGTNERSDSISNYEYGFIIKLNPTGDILFYKKMEYDGFSTVPKDIVLTDDGDILITGFAYSDSPAIYTSFLQKINTDGEIIYNKSFNTTSMGKVQYSLSILPLENGGFAFGGIIQNVAQFSLMFPNVRVTFIAILDENENYISCKSYYTLPYSHRPSLQLKAKKEGGYNMAFSSFGSEPLQYGVTILQLDENFEGGCNEADITDEIFLSNETGWSLVDLPANPVPYGFQFTHLYELESFEYDTIISVCDNFARANFSVQNLCPESDDPIVFVNESSGEIISLEWNIDEVVFANDENVVEYNFTGSGSFSAQLIVSDGCTIDTISKIIEKYATSEVTEIDTIICSDSPFIFNGTTYVESILEDQTFIYKDTLTNMFGCDSIDRLVALIEVCSCQAIFPNAFTPDQDGLNDFFHPIIDCDYQIENYNLLLFNRWGQLIFKTDKLDKKWDGTFNGKPVPTDVLVFKVQYDVIDWNGILIRQTNESGDVTLIR